MCEQYGDPQMHIVHDAYVAFLTDCAAHQQKQQKQPQQQQKQQHQKQKQTQTAIHQPTDRPLKEVLATFTPNTTIWEAMSSMSVFERMQFADEVIASGYLRRQEKQESCAEDLHIVRVTMPLLTLEDLVTSIKLMSQHVHVFPNAEVRAYLLYQLLDPQRFETIKRSCDPCSPPLPFAICNEHCLPVRTAPQKKRDDGDETFVDLIAVPTIVRAKPFLQTVLHHIRPLVDIVATYMDPTHDAVPLSDLASFRMPDDTMMAFEKEWNTCHAANLKIATTIGIDHHGDLDYRRRFGVRPPHVHFSRQKETAPPEVVFCRLSRRCFVNAEVEKACETFVQPSTPCLLDLRFPEEWLHLSLLFGMTTYNAALRTFLEVCDSQQCALWLVSFNGSAANIRTNVRSVELF